MATLKSFGFLWIDSASVRQHPMFFQHSIFRISLRLLAF
ncbi:hypothetical protein SynBIOSE41_01374 [Synechococcus sp. BIOS-E4-1]|nr:hypothetical protein SynBIOSE41_01374 [Synechococcus sp. BIOS-E4-1]